MTYALDPTGRHILEEKVRGKLLGIDAPQIVLVTRGKVASDWSGLDETDGWTMVKAAAIGRQPAPEHFDKLDGLLNRLAPARGTA